MVCHSESSFKIRAILFIVIFSLGLVSGFYYHFSSYKEVSFVEETIKRKPDLSYMGFEVSSPNHGTKLINARIPSYENGVITTEVLAKEIVWKKDKPIELKDITVREFSEDGTRVTSVMTGDFGEMEINQENELERMRIWGNTKVTRFGLSELKEEK
jgi:hypothetical protein